MHTHTVLTSQDSYALMVYGWIDCLKYVQEVMALDSIDSTPPKIAKFAINYGFGGSTSDPRKNPLCPATSAEPFYVHSTVAEGKDVTL